jgi:hypothetical protein
MKHQRHFDTSAATHREAAQIRKMIGDLDRIVQLLSCDITTEEERVGISDRSDVAYPTLARTLATRRDNLKDTTTALDTGQHRRGGGGRFCAGHFPRRFLRGVTGAVDFASCRGSRLFGAALIEESSVEFLVTVDGIAVL